MDDVTGEQVDAAFSFFPTKLLCQVPPGGLEVEINSARSAPENEAHPKKQEPEMILPAAGAVNSLPAAAGQGSGNLIAAPPPLFSLNVAGFSFGIFLNFSHFQVGHRVVRSILRNCNSFPIEFDLLKSGQIKFDINSVKCQN